ncbi:flagellar protein FlbD [Jatrophihabitans endophyticus]|uniref:Flagellar protein FlbD n=1 Tax=Jatrophihabitans endophyticus TaxID=1206085 RepID=A0A1M5IH19_9ACTN|nr:flagellar FlbD family protein [Jatrophihabitans endophyticus]SHG27230.1 flagellar protein FlbD [Jatrophihabitans endophyticus]
MLQLTRLTGQSFALNPDLIERAEATPDTVVTLVNGSKYVVQETLDELIELVRAYRADIVHASRAGVPPVAPHRPRVPARDGSSPRHTADNGTVVMLRAEQGDV